MRAISLAFVCFAVGVAVGYLLRQPDDSESKLADLVVAAPREVSLREWLDAYPKPEIPRGDGTVTGTVRFEDGSPAAGVQIRANLVGSDPSWGVGSIVDLGDVEHAVRAILWHWYLHVNPIAEATTDENGEYELDGLADRYYTVWGHLDGYWIKEERRLDFTGPGTVKDFVSKRICDVTIDVRLPDGRQPSRAVLHWETSEQADYGPWKSSDIEGAFPAGRYTWWATVWRNEVRLYESEKVTVELKGGEHPKILLELRPVVD